MPDIVSGYAAGFAEYLPPGPVIIGRDGRPSGNWIEMTVAGALAACGREVRLIGIAPTPTVQYAIEESNAAGGIAVTASHNPGKWNGLKFLNSDGIFLDKKENKKFWEIVDRKVFNYSGYTDSVIIEPESLVLDMHIDSILYSEAWREKIINNVRDREFRVVVDAVNASGSKALPLLLKRLGCTVIKLYCDNDGIFPHTPEPLPENLGELAKAVRKNKADLGIAVDPDADRLVLIDETGSPIGEEKTIVLATEAALELTNHRDQSKKPAVVVNYSTTRLVEDIATKLNADVHRSPVGEINVVKKMKETGAVIGGEGSGGVIFPASHYGRDSLVGTALTLSLLAHRGAGLSEICRDYPHYEMLKKKREFKGDIDLLLDKIENEFAGEDYVRDDGIKVNIGNGWVQLRASNTEPVVRIISEAPTRAEADKLSASIEKIIESM